MSEPFRWFSQRRKVKNRPWPCTQWRGFLIGTFALVVVSFSVFDFPVAVMAKDINVIVRSYGTFITDFGKSDWMLYASFLAFVLGLSASGLAAKTDLRKRAKGVYLAQAASFVFVSVAASGLLANLLKKMIGRPRPSLLYSDIGPFEFHIFEFNSKFASFPSGHATTTAAVFTAAAFFFPRHRVLCFSAAFMIAMSRVIVGAHYPSDVIAGLAFGSWCTFFTAIVYSRYRMVFNVGDGGWPMPRNSIASLKLGFAERRKAKAKKQSDLDLQLQKGQ